LLLTRENACAFSNLTSGVHPSWHFSCYIKTGLHSRPVASICVIGLVASGSAKDDPSIDAALRYRLINYLQTKFNTASAR
jgi:hypothetical protein